VLQLSVALQSFLHVLALASLSADNMRGEGGRDSGETTGRAMSYNYSLVTAGKQRVEQCPITTASWHYSLVALQPRDSGETTGRAMFYNYSLVTAGKQRDEQCPITTASWHYSLVALQPRDSGETTGRAMSYNYSLVTLQPRGTTASWQRGNNRTSNVL